MAPGDLTASVWRALTDPGTVELLLGVAVITSLAGVLREFGLLDTMVRSVTRLVGGARLAIMAVPSIIGALPVIGGAILSAPMVDGLGDSLGLSRIRKAAVNLIFRHAWFFIAPFTPSLVLAARLAGVPLDALILRNLPFTAVMLVGGYLVLLQRARPTAAESAASADAGDTGGAGTARRAALAVFLTSASPLIVGVILSVGLGPLRPPIYLSVGLGLVLALILSRGHEGFRLLGLPAAWAGIQWKIVYAMAGVMVFSRVMTDSGASGALVSRLVGAGLPPWVLTLLLPMAVGFVSGVPTVHVGIALPVVLPLVHPDQLAAVTAVLYTSGFIAYFMSPVHLCQIFSGQYFGVSPTRLYREYWPVMVLMTACAVACAWAALG